jgi:hypothetical protein
LHHSLPHSRDRNHRAGFYAFYDKLFDRQLDIVDWQRHKDIAADSARLDHLLGRSAGLRESLIASNFLFQYAFYKRSKIPCKARQIAGKCESRKVRAW